MSHSDPAGDCPACNLRNIPVTDGKLHAHAWHRGTWVDGPDDENGDPTPGEWRGGCHNRAPKEPDDLPPL